MKAIAIKLNLLFLATAIVGAISCKKPKEVYPEVEPNVYLTNRPAAGAAAFVKAVSVSEGTTPGVARVYVDKLSTTAVTATVTFTGTAAAGTDYTLPASLNITIPANQYYAEILFPIIDDTVRESAETIIITLVSASGGYKPGLGTAGTNAVFTYTITDND